MKVSRNRRAILLVGLLTLGYATIGHAAPGDLDKSFSGDGKAWTDFSPGEDIAYSAALQPNGKIIVAGKANGHVALARIGHGGGLETGFGGGKVGGKVITRVGAASVGYGVARQPDGKIVVAGQSDDNMLVIRYLATGLLDTSFSGDGILTTDFFGGYEEASAVAIQPDGKIIVAGTACSVDCDFALARYLPNGDLDPFFQGGKVTTHLMYDDWGFALVLQPDGKIIVGGAYDINGVDGLSAFALVRYLPDGVVDASFGFEGAVVTFLFGHQSFVTALALQPDGKIVATGPDREGAAGGGGDVVVVRYLPDGMLDDSFGTDGAFGISYVGLGMCDGLNGGMNGCTSPEPSSVVLDPNGRIIVAGVTFDLLQTDDSDFALARLLPNGVVDASFGDTGYVTTFMFGNDDYAWALLIQPDGKLVAVGGGRNGQFSLARYLGD